MTKEEWLEDVIAQLLDEQCDAICVLQLSKDRIGKVAYYNTTYADKAIMKQYINDSMTRDYLEALPKREASGVGLGALAGLLSGMLQHKEEQQNDDSEKVSGQHEIAEDVES